MRIKYPEDYHEQLFEKILKNISDKEIVKFTLYCAEDCIHLTESQNSRNCIEITKKWLAGKKIKQKELLDAFDSTANYEFDNSSEYANNAAASSIYTILNILRKNSYYEDPSSVDVIYSTLDFYNINYIAGSARDCAGFAYEAFNEEQRESKREEYLSYARMFLHEKEHNPIPNTPKLDSEYNIALFLDQLEDHNIFVHENFELKLPKGYQIKGGDKLDLVNKIAGSRFAIDYLNYLFQSEI